MDNLNVGLSITASICVKWYSSRLLTHTTVDYVNFMQEYTWIYKLNFTQCVRTGYIKSWILSPLSIGYPGIYSCTMYCLLTIHCGIFCDTHYSAIPSTVECSVGIVNTIMNNSEQRHR